MKRLYEPQEKPMSVAVFTSDSGMGISNIIKTGRSLEKGRGSPFAVTAICSDSLKSEAAEIGSRFKVPAFVHDLDAFCMELGTVRRDRSVRPAYFRMVMEDLEVHGIEPDLIALVDYKTIVTEPLLGRLAINIHDADLSIRGEDGKAVYTGAWAFRTAVLRDSRREARASTHMVTEEADQGPVLMVSAPVEVPVPESIATKSSISLMGVMRIEKVYLKLIRKADKGILPRTIAEMARGNFAVSCDGILHYRGVPIPYGYDYETKRPISAPRQ